MSERPGLLHVPFEATGRVLLSPPTESGDGPASLLLAVHGYGQAVEDLLAFARRVAPDALVALPLGPSAFYRRARTPDGVRREVRHGWIAAEDRAHDDRRNDAYLAATLAELARLHKVQPERVTLLGYSQGVGVATHFLLSHPEAAGRLVGLAGGLARAYRGDLERLAGKRVLWVTGRRDVGYPPAYNRALVAALRTSGAALQALDLDAGHDLLSDAEAHVRRWLRDGSSG